MTSCEYATVLLSVSDADGPDDRERIREEMRDADEPRRASDIADDANVDYVSTQKLLRELRDEGVVELVGDKGWRRARDEWGG